MVTEQSLVNCESVERRLEDAQAQLFELEAIFAGFDRIDVRGRAAIEESLRQCADVFKWSADVIAAVTLAQIGGSA